MIEIIVIKKIILSIKRPWLINLIIRRIKEIWIDLIRKDQIIINLWWWIEIKKEIILRKNRLKIKNLRFIKWIKIIRTKIIRFNWYLEILRIRIN